MVRARAGRGRNGRGRGGRRGGGSRNSQVAYREIAVPKSGDADVLSDSFNLIESFDQSITAILTGQSTFKQQYEAQNFNRDRYLAILLIVRSRSVQLHDGSKSRALAAAWARRDYGLAKTMLGLPDEEFALKEVLKAVSILDAGRNKRAQTKILRRLEAQGCRKRVKISQLKATIASLDQDTPHVGSLSGALIRHIKAWFKTIPAKRLSFFAHHFPTEPWKKLADICHLHPEKDIPQCPWFLHFVFGKEIPIDESKQMAMDDVSDGLTADNISSKVLESEIDYTVARKFKKGFTDKAKERIAGYAPLDTVIWYYEELSCPNLDKILKERLENNQSLSMPYGKLMERIQTFTLLKEEKQSAIDCLPFIDDLFPIAEEKLGKLSLNLESPVVVIGDKSGSMQTAIRTSNIIASFLSKVANADLVFFDSQNVIPPFIPKTVKEVMDLSKLILADNCTIPAASLYPYYSQKKIVKTFIIVTDEGENGKCENCSFAEMFNNYYKEVYPASLVFISIVNYNRSQMINDLRQKAPHIKPLYFEFMEARPDLTKLESILGMLSLRSPGLKADVDNLEQQIKEQGLQNILESLKI